MKQKIKEAWKKGSNESVEVDDLCKNDWDELWQNHDLNLYI
jgi:hypothetical protein